MDQLTEGVGNAVTELLKQMAQIIFHPEKDVYMSNRGQLQELLKQMSQHVFGLFEESTRSRFAQLQTTVVQQKDVLGDQEEDDSSIISTFERTVIEHGWNTMEEETFSIPTNETPAPLKHRVNQIIEQFQRSDIGTLFLEDDIWVPWIMREMKNQVIKSPLFDTCIRLNWYDLRSVQGIQEKIARNLPWLSVEEDEIAPSKLHTCLEKIKLLLVVRLEYVYNVAGNRYPDLDNVISRIWDAGVPKPNAQNSIKIFFELSKDKYKSWANKSYQENHCYFEPQLFSRLEIRDLFYYKVGKGVQHSPLLDFFAKRIGDFLSHDISNLPKPYLPNGIIKNILLLGGGLRYVTNVSVWEKAWTNLNPQHTPFEVVVVVPGPKIPRIAYGCIIESDDQLRNCFLLCYQLFPIEYDIDINELILYWYMEGFFDENIHHLGPQVYHKGLFMLNQLLDRSLLYRVSNKCVNLNDIMANYYKFKFPSEPRRMSMINTKVKILPIDFQDKYTSLKTFLFIANPLHRVLDGFFEQMRTTLQILNLSETLIVSLPTSLPRLCNLRFLSLMRCRFLRTISYIEGLEKLEVLLLSGCSRLNEIPDPLFENMPLLHVLDLTNTMIESLRTSLSKLCKLHVLILQHCRFLKHASLEVALNYMPSIRVLDLSKTQIETLPPSLSKLDNLRVLLLRRCKFLKSIYHVGTLKGLEEIHLLGCENLMEMPNTFQDMKNLRVLDISGTQVIQLSLRGFHSFETMLHMAETTNLEILDLSSTAIKTFPYEILTSTSLKHLDLSETKGIRNVNWKKIRRLPERLIWIQYSLESSWKEQLTENCAVYLHLYDSSILRSLDKDCPLWRSLTSFFFRIVPSMDRDEDSDIFYQRKGFLYRDIYLKGKKIIDSSSHDRCLVIQRGNNLPDGIISGVLYHTKLLHIVHNDFVIRISDLGVENMMELNTLVLERCNGMVNVFAGDELKDSALPSLENLYASNLTTIRSVWDGSTGERSFEHLKFVYLDCCPKLINVFSLGLVLQNLEKLEIKFCDRLEAIIGEELTEECYFPRLKMLCLWQLPKLRSICGGVLQALTTLKVRACMKLKELPLGDHTLEGGLEIRGESKWWDALRWKDKRIKSRVQFNRWDHT